jgi:hypothetical protein
MEQHEQRVTFACAGCGEYFVREALKIAEGCVYCSGCHPTTLPAPALKIPHARGPQPQWRKR